VKLRKSATEVTAEYADHAEKKGKEEEGEVNDLLLFR
jgi:hypothetical protein